jgi:hypothetical protein
VLSGMVWSGRGLQFPSSDVGCAMSMGGPVWLESGTGLERVGLLGRVSASSGSFDYGRRDEAAPASAQDDGRGHTGEAGGSYFSCSRSETWVPEGVGWTGRSEF